jgi:hypothetical protein
MRRNPFTILALFLALLIPTAIVLADETVTLGNTQIDLVSHEENADGTDTFTYAATTLAGSAKLLDWTIGFDTCLDYLEAPEEGPYTTVTNITACSDGTYTCREVTYTVVTGSNPDLGISGVTFTDGSAGLGVGLTHVFQITVSEMAYMDTIPVGVHDSDGRSLTGAIDGPVCGTGTAVSLASIDAGVAQSGALLPILAVAVILMLGLTFAVTRRKAAEVRSR